MPTMTPTTRRLATAAVGGATALALALGAMPANAATTLERTGNFRVVLDQLDAERVKATVTNQQSIALYKLSVVAKGPVTKTLFQIGPGNTYPTLASGSMGAVISTLPPGEYTVVARIGSGAPLTKSFIMKETIKLSQKPKPGEPAPAPSGPDFGSLKF